MNIFEKFKRRWVQEKLDVHSGKDEQTIVECFEKLGVTPSADLLNLYKILDGKDCMDDEHFRLWSLKEIQEENSTDSEIEITKKFGVLFGDYCINCWCYRVNTKGEVYIDYFADNKEPILRSSSLVEFFQLMEKDPDEALL
jgi:hypothetical protein